MAQSSGPINAGQPERCHPYYAAHYRRWLLNEAAYLGGDKWYEQGDTYQLGPFQVRAATPGKTGPGQVTFRESNRLWRHEREKDIRYQRRLRMAVYENVFGPQINTVAATIAKACKGITWPAGLEYLETNTDRWGQDAATMRMRRIAWAHVQGHVYTLLEKPEASTAPPSRMHELAAGLRTYACTLTPRDLHDWSWDAERVRFRWALIRVAMPAERVSPDQPESENGDQPVWTKLYKQAETEGGSAGEWILYRDGKEFSRGAAPPFVPITVQFAIGQDPTQAEPVGIAINDDVTDLVELRFNKSSWLSDQEASHTFNQAFIKTSSTLDDEMDQFLGVHTYIGADDFKWVAPDTAPMAHLMASMDRDAASIRQMGGVETKGETSQAAKSGVALQLEQQNMSSLFAMYAAAAEAGETAVWQMAAELEGVDSTDLVVRYERDFSALDSAARFGTLMAALTGGGYVGEAKAELQKQLFTAAHPECEAEVRDRIFAGIDEQVKLAEEQAESMRVSMKAAADRAAGGEMPADDGEDAEDDMRPGFPPKRVAEKPEAA